MAETNTALKPLVDDALHCDGCDHDADDAWAYRVETHDGEEFIAVWCLDCANVARVEPESFGYVAVREMNDEEPSNADWKSVGPEAIGSQLVPERIVVDLPAHGMVTVLAAWDVDYWMLRSAHVVHDGSVVELTTPEQTKVRSELTARRGREARDF